MKETYGLIAVHVCFACVLLAFPWGTAETWSSQQSSAETGGVPWWFDLARGTVCWVGQSPRYSEFEFIVDLDGNHSSGLSSIFDWSGDVGNYTTPMTWNGRGGSTIGDEDGTGPTLLSEALIRPPYPRIQFSLGGLALSEWFHLFITKRTIPTNWILGTSDDNGRRAMPISRPFWVTVDNAKTWTEYDPVAFAGPIGDCIEDMPETPTIEAAIDFDPDNLNPGSQGRWVTVYIELPEDYDPQDIDATTVRLNDTLVPALDPKYGFAVDPAGYIMDHDRDGLMERMVKFDRGAVMGLLSPGTYPLRVTGSLASGDRFEGLSEPIRFTG